MNNKQSIKINQIILSIQTELNNNTKHLTESDISSLNKKIKSLTSEIKQINDSDQFRSAIVIEDFVHKFILLSEIVLDENKTNCNVLLNKMLCIIIIYLKNINVNYLLGNKEYKTFEKLMKTILLNSINDKEESADNKQTGIKLILQILKNNINFNPNNCSKLIINLEELLVVEYMEYALANNKDFLEKYYLHFLYNMVSGLNNEAIEYILSSPKTDNQYSTTRNVLDIQKLIIPIKRVLTNYTNIIAPSLTSHAVCGEDALENIIINFKTANIKMKALKCLLLVIKTQVENQSFEGFARNFNSLFYEYKLIGMVIISFLNNETTIKSTDDHRFLVLECLFCLRTMVETMYNLLFDKNTPKNYKDYIEILLHNLTHDMVYIKLFGLLSFFNTKKDNIIIDTSNKSSNETAVENILIYYYYINKFIDHITYNNDIFVIRAKSKDEHLSILKNKLLDSNANLDCSDTLFVYKYYIKNIIGTNKKAIQKILEYSLKLLKSHAFDRIMHYLYDLFNRIYESNEIIHVNNLANLQNMFKLNELLKKIKTRQNKNEDELKFVEYHSKCIDLIMECINYDKNSLLKLIVEMDIFIVNKSIDKNIQNDILVQHDSDEYNPDTDLLEICDNDYLTSEIEYSEIPPLHKNVLDNNHYGNLQITPQKRKNVVDSD